METHLGVLESVSIPGYVWFGNHRKFINSSAPKPSGGVGILFKEQLSCTYQIKIIDKQLDGILAIGPTVCTGFLCPSNYSS